MDIPLGRVAARWEQPTTLKFARPVVILPELFTTSSHLSLLTGYLVSVGWEVFAIDLYSPFRGRRHFADLCELAADAIAAISREVIVLGHGLGGLLAFALQKRSTVTASVALAPSLPGFRSPLLEGLRNRIAMIRGASIRPPSGRTLFELVADADRFQREGLIGGLTVGDPTALREVARGEIELTSVATTPRLIVAGDSDIFAPAEAIVRFAAAAGAQLATIPGRGHWIIGGRALEKTIAEIQRFLIKRLGHDLLLLYPEDSG